MAQITQLSPTRHSVITLGHNPEVPLMCPASELSYGFEPHDTILLSVSGSGVGGVGHERQRGRWGCTRGGAGWVGTMEGYTGYYPAVQIEAYLRYN